MNKRLFHNDSFMNGSKPMAKLPVNDLESRVSITYAASAMISGVRHCAAAAEPPNISIAAVIIAKTINRFSI